VIATDDVRVTSSVNDFLWTWTQHKWNTALDTKPATSQPPREETGSITSQMAAEYPRCTLDRTAKSEGEQDTPHWRVQLRSRRHHWLGHVTCTWDGTSPDFHDLTRSVTCLLNRPVDRWKLTALDRPVDRQKLKHSDQTLPCQTAKTAVYTTVRLHSVDKCQLSLHYHISIQSNENIAHQFQPLIFVSLWTCAALAFYADGRSPNIDPSRSATRQATGDSQPDWFPSLTCMTHNSVSKQAHDR